MGVERTSALGQEPVAGGVGYRPVPWATIWQAVGQRDLATTANTYSHTLVSEDELDYERMLR